MSRVILDSWFAPFVVLDTETTGLQPGDRLIELAVSMFRVVDYGKVNIIDNAGFEVVECPKISMISEYFTVLNPEHVEVTDEIVRLTGITREDIARAPVFHDVLPWLSRMLMCSPIVSYNWAFDRRMLVSELDLDCATEQLKGRLDLYTHAIDPLVLVRRFARYFKGKSLTTVAKSLGYEHLAHRAREDCAATSYVFACLVGAAGLLVHEPAEVAELCTSWANDQELEFQSYVVRTYGRPKFVQCQRCGIWTRYMKSEHTCMPLVSWPRDGDLPTREEIEAYLSERRVQ